MWGFLRRRISEEEIHYVRRFMRKRIFEEEDV